MKLKTWISLLFLLCTQISLTTIATATPRYAPVEIDARCGFGEKIDFNGLAYFCYNDPVSGAQLYRTNGGRENWEAVTGFASKTVSKIDVLFTTQSELFFLADGRLFKTSGQPGDYTEIGSFENGSYLLTHIASDGGTHFFRSDESLYIAGNTPGSIQLIGTTTRDAGLSRSDVIYYKGYLYYVDTSSTGYWNLLKRADRNGRSELVKEFPKGTDTVIYPVSNDIGFSILNYGGPAGWYRVTGNGTVTSINFKGEPIGRVGSKLIFEAIDELASNKLYVTRDLDAFVSLGTNWEGGSFSAEFDNYSIFSCRHFQACGQTLVTNGTPSGTHIVGGRALFKTVDPNAGLLVLRNTNELHFMDKDNPQELTKVVEFSQAVTHAFLRDSSSYYVFTEEDTSKGEVSKLWLVSRDSTTPVLISEHKRKIVTAATEGQRLYFSEATQTPDSYLWHSAGSPETTYILRNPQIALQTLAWLAAIQLLLQQE